jgi:hypothetical protein
MLLYAEFSRLQAAVLVMVLLGRLIWCLPRACLPALDDALSRLKPNQNGIHSDRMMAFKAEINNFL